jgi:hypothetical protein
VSEQTPSYSFPFPFGSWGGSWDSSVTGSGSSLDWIAEKAVTKNHPRKKKIGRRTSLLSEEEKLLGLGTNPLNVLCWKNNICCHRRIF